MPSGISVYAKRSLYHGYLPATPEIHGQFLDDLFGTGPPEDHTQPVKHFLEKLKELGIKEEIKRDFDRAVAQADQFKKWADPKYKVKSFDDFIKRLNVIVRVPPHFYKAKVDDNVIIGEPIGVPIYLLLDLISNTSVAFTFLTWDKFNQALKVLLDGWGDYLKDPKRDSNKTLNDKEWFSPEGLHLLESGLGNLTFAQTYQSDKVGHPYYYKTWDSFFTRPLKDGVRPIRPQPSAGDPFYVYNPCEGTVFRVALNVQLHDTFWLKSQDYSLVDMLGSHSSEALSCPQSYAERLEGGSVFQAFLSPQDFHRWHSPIQGKVLKGEVIDGTYYAVLPDDGASKEDPDLLPGDPHGAIIRSQPWLSASATRAVFIIEPTDPKSPIDLVAFIAIGMVEVSTCDITYKKRNVHHPELVEVGDELGMFHFGGSSQTLIVKPKEGHYLAYQDLFNSPVRPGQHRWIRSVIGKIFKKK